MSDTPLRLGTSTAGLTHTLPQDLRTRMIAEPVLSEQDTELIRAAAADYADRLAESRIQSLEIFISQAMLDLGLEHPWLRIADRRGDGYEVWSAHAPFGQVDLASQDEEFRATSLRTVIAAARLAADLGAGILTLHAGKETPDPNNRPDRLRLCAQSIAAVADVCAQLGITVAVEMLPRRCLGNTVEELLAILEAADRPNVAFCLDTNHTFPAGALTDVVQALGKHLITLHVSDHDDLGEKHWLPLRGVVDWTAFIRSLREIGYAGPFLYELPLRCNEFSDAVATLEGNYRQLMEAAA